MMTELLLGTLLLSGIILGLAASVLTAKRVLVPRRPVRIVIGSDHEVEATTGVRLLDALAAASIHLPSACGGKGTCGQCRLKVVEDAPSPLPTEMALLKRAELTAGERLACQITLRKDMSVALPTGILSARSFEAEIVHRTLLTPMICELRVRIPPEAAFKVEAGSFMQITAPAMEIDYKDIEVPDEFEQAWRHLRSLGVRSNTFTSRAYSIANTPAETDRGELVFLIRLALPPPGPSDIPPGIVSSWLFSLSEGDRIALSGPYGEFRATDADADMVLVGGGVGMAPLRAIIHEQLARYESTRKIEFWYGARSAEDRLYVDEFNTLEKNHPNFKWVTVLSDPAAEALWEGPTGFVHERLRDDWLKSHPAPEGCEYFLCGPPLMMSAVSAVLDDASVPRERIFFDDFGG